MSDSWTKTGIEALETAEGGLGTTGNPVLDKAKRRFQRCAEWEAAARERFIEDVKFANGDSDNGYQWPNAIRRSRDVGAKPCLTMNLIRQHNLQIINSGKQQKKEVKILPVGNGATAESAKMLRAITRHIQYQSQAQTAYSIAREFQVDGGIGYWRLHCDYVGNESWDQEIYILPLTDPLTVYMDPDIRQRNGSDAKFGFVFDTVPREDFREAYPKFASLFGLQPMGVSSGDDDWVSRDHVRICEYFHLEPRADKLVSFVHPETRERHNIRKSHMPKAMYEKIIDHPLTRQRDVWDNIVEWDLIVGDQIIDSTTWPGKYIPLIRCIGTETCIGGIMDRKGHTRAMKDSQRMLNYNASAQVEHVALQGKTPWYGAADSIEDFETYWNTANTNNHSFLPFNHLDDQGNPLPPQALPQRVQPPMASPAFEAGMTTAFNQLMMVSGQWQNQMGMMGNERTGAAIDKRQDQGDTATYHFQDAFEEALIFTGMQIVDLIPQIYDTKRILLIQADDGTDQEIEMDPAARQAYLEQRNQDGRVVKRIFNPALGRYDVIAAPGSAIGSRREETVQALTLILTQAPGLTGIIGDLLLSAMDFDEAQEAAQRLKRMVPPQALGQGPTQAEQSLQAQVMQLRGALAEALQRLGKEQVKLTGKDQMRDIDVYKAETDRFKALADMLMLDEGGIRQVVDQLVGEAANTHLGPILQANAKDLDSGSEAEDETSQGNSNLASALAPMPGAKQAPDGEWYLADPTRRGKYMRIAPLAQEHEPRSVISNG